jgi:hypothetical protein
MWRFSNNSDKIAQDLNAALRARDDQIDELNRQPMTRREVEVLLCQEKQKAKINRRAGQIATGILNSSVSPQILSENVITAIKQLSSSYAEEKQLLAELKALLPRVKTLLAANETLSPAGNAAIVAAAANVPAAAAANVPAAAAAAAK